MLKLTLSLVFALIIAAGTVGCHASGHVDDDGVGAEVHGK